MRGAKFEVAQVLVCLQHAAPRADHVWQRLRERDAPGFHIFTIQKLKLTTRAC